MLYLFILNDPPYGTERCYNALRLALALAKQPDTSITLFLMGAAVLCAKHGQTTPEGSYNIERMLRGCAVKRVDVSACGTWMDARGPADGELMPEARRSSMAELAEWSAEADKSWCGDRAWALLTAHAPIGRSPDADLTVGSRHLYRFVDFVGERFTATDVAGGRAHPPARSDRRRVGRLLRSSATGALTPTASGHGALCYSSHTASRS